MPTRRALSTRGIQGLRGSKFDRLGIGKRETAALGSRSGAQAIWHRLPPKKRLGMARSAQSHAFKTRPLRLPQPSPFRLRAAALHFAAGDVPVLLELGLAVPLPVMPAPELRAPDAPSEVGAASAPPVSVFGLLESPLPV
jgi:hypothetical protein